MPRASQRAIGHLLPSFKSCIFLARAILVFASRPGYIVMAIWGIAKTSFAFDYLTYYDMECSIPFKSKKAHSGSNALFNVLFNYFFIIYREQNPTDGNPAIHPAWAGLPRP